MSSGFGFLFTTAGFNTDFSLIPYAAGGTYLRVFVVGILNTLLVSVLSIIATTILGFVIGVLRLSSNWLIARLALAYVEIIRNVPLLLQIVFWYVGVFALLPRVKQSIGVLDISFLNNRGMFMPAPVFGDLFWATVVAFFLAIVIAVGIKRWARRRQELTGQQFPVFIVSLAIYVFLPLIVFFARGSPLTWDVPLLQGFNFQGGMRLPPAFLALFVALSIYHASHLAEAVRAGILSVSKGQTEAASSLGLPPGKTMKLIIIPQAMRAIVPPLISNCMNVVKNSSLAVAIGYSDIVALFMQTALNQSGYAIEIVAMTMGFYFVISVSISAVLNVYNKRVQIKER